VAEPRYQPDLKFLLAQRNRGGERCNSATNSANAGVASRLWPRWTARKSLKTQQPALARAGHVRLEGCCSIHLSYGRALLQSNIIH
jgi:hypothetical protein